MYNSIKQINVNDFEVVKAPKRKTLFERLSKQNQALVKSFEYAYPKYYYEVTEWLTSNTSYVNVTLEQYYDLLMYLKLPTIHPSELFSHDN